MQKITNPIIAAILWANLSSIASGFMVVWVRTVSESLPVIEIIFLRNVFAFLMFIPLVIYNGGVEFLKTSKIFLHFLRGLSGVVAMVALFFSISKLNLTIVTSLTYTAPLFTAILAYFVFNDRLTKAKILSLFIGFLGVLIILRPGFDSFDPLFLLVIFATFFWAISGILIKQMSKTDHPIVITFYMTIFMMLLTAPFMFFVWKTPNAEHLVYIFLIAVASNILQFSLAKALSLVDISVILPVDFTRLIYTMILAYIAFNERPDLTALIGAIIIITAAFYSTYKENTRSKNATAKSRTI